MPRLDYSRVMVRMVRKSLNRLPESGGVYCFMCGKTPIYIGKTKNIRYRIITHWKRFSSIADTVRFMTIEDLVQRNHTERWLIGKYIPKYNMHHSGRSFLDMRNPDNPNFVN